MMEHVSGYYSSMRLQLHYLMHISYCLLVLGRPPPHFQLAGAVSGEEQPTSRKLDGPNFLRGQQCSNPVERWQVEQADAIAVVEGAQENWRLPNSVHAEECAQTILLSMGIFDLKVS